MNFEGWLTGSIFEPLRTPSNFERFFVDGGTGAWPNRADIAPEALYDAVSALRSDHALLRTTP